MSQVFELGPRTIFVTLAGSHAHGTAHAGSDLDLRGVCIAPLAVRVSLRERFEQSDQALEGALWHTVQGRILEHPTARHAIGGKVESVIFDIAKFIGLCAEANPNALEILFADQRDWVFHTSAWEKLHGARQSFLSRKAQQTYLGYALAQLKRIRTHRAWLLEPPAKKPERADFALPDSATVSHDDRNRIELAIAEKLRSWDVDSLEMPRATRIALEARLRQFWLDSLGSSEGELEHDLWRVAAQSLGLSAALIATLEAERKYRAASKHWESYQRWKDERNPARAELEARFGYDTKHAMHLVRLMRTGLELLESGTLRVRRADAAELVAIRDGAVTYDELVAQAEEMQDRMRRAAETTSLPNEVDQAAIERLLVELVQAAG